MGPQGVLPALGPPALKLAQDAGGGDMTGLLIGFALVAGLAFVAWVALARRRGGLEEELNCPSTAGESFPPAG
jgi:hypothetical protein